MVWTSSAPELVTVYQGGLVQRLHQTTNAVTLTAKTLTGVTARAVSMPPSFQNQNQAHIEN